MKWDSTAGGVVITLACLTALGTVWGYFIHQNESNARLLELEVLDIRTYNKGVFGSPSYSACVVEIDDERRIVPEHICTEEIGDIIKVKVYPNGHIAYRRY